MATQKIRYKLTTLIVLAVFSFSGTASAYTADMVLDSRGMPAPLEQAAESQTPFRSLQTFEAQLDNQSPIKPDTQAGTDPTVNPNTPSLSSYGKQFFPDLVHGTAGIFSRDNLPLALIGGGLAALAYSVDHVDLKVKNYFQTRRPLNGPAKYGDMIGQGYYHVAVGAALLGAGELANNKKLADTGVVTLEALLINGIATEGLKYSFARTRPNGGNRMSFPSGHASSTATLAASISAMYDWDLRITIPLYATAVFVGASRIQENEHYLSDVIAGLTLGTIIGSSFARYHKEKDNEQTGWKNISFSPLVEKDLKGGLFTMKW